jgi:hypothetical protein
MQDFLLHLLLWLNRGLCYFGGLPGREGSIARLVWLSHHFAGKLEGLINLPGDLPVGPSRRFF